MFTRRAGVEQYIWFLEERLCLKLLSPLLVGLLSDCNKKSNCEVNFRQEIVCVVLAAITAITSSEELNVN